MTEHSHHNIHVFINRGRYELATPQQSGAALKELAHIPLTDALFLQQHGEDMVIRNDQTVCLRDGDHLHSQPPADYGAAAIDTTELVNTGRVEALTQPDGWTMMIVHDWRLPATYEPQTVKLLVKLPPLFPEAQPDMFWIAPDVRTTSGQVPHGASLEEVLGEPWQRFSWHLKPGAWVPGVSTLGDFMRAIKARFERGN